VRCGARYSPTSSGTPRGVDGFELDARAPGPGPAGWYTRGRLSPAARAGLRIKAAQCGAGREATERGALGAGPGGRASHKWSVGTGTFAPHAAAPSRAADQRAPLAAPPVAAAAAANVLTMVETRGGACGCGVCWGCFCACAQALRALPSCGDNGAA